MRRYASAVGEMSPADEINLTPMLDVVFIMLIFFVLTASFIKEAGIEVRGSEQAAQRVSVAAAVLVEIFDDDRIRVNGNVVDPRAVRAHLQALHAMDPEQPVVVQVSDRSSVQTLVRVLDAAELAAIDQVSVGPFEPTPE